MSHAGVYQSLTRQGDAYIARAEEPKPWWNPFPETVRHVAGTPLYVFSAIKAPVAFSTSVTHEWEYYVPGKGWERRSRISFPITGGRAEGYRGYSLAEHPEAGKWRVIISTGGQTIGRITFKVEDAQTVKLDYAETL